MMTALIDADSILYTVGWNLRDTQNEAEMRPAVDSVVKYILNAADATHFVGALSDSYTFRHDVYKFAKYKGARKESMPAIEYWKPLIREYLKTEWGFVLIPKLEADDVVSYLASCWEDTIICSSDKDLKQIPGKLLNITSSTIEEISEQEAAYFLKYQMLMGDSTDNVKGIPGMGEKKAQKYLQEGGLVYDKYIEYFGEHYGAIIYVETLATLKMMQPSHDYISFFESALRKLQSTQWREPSIFG
jgi:DNA polymerase I